MCSLCIHFTERVDVGIPTGDVINTVWQEISSQVQMLKYCCFLKDSLQYPHSVETIDCLNAFVLQHHQKCAHVSRYICFFLSPTKCCNVQCSSQIQNLKGYIYISILFKLCKKWHHVNIFTSRLKLTKYQQWYHLCFFNAIQHFVVMDS